MNLWGLITEIKGSKTHCGFEHLKTVNHFLMTGKVKQSTCCHHILTSRRAHLRVPEKAWWHNKRCGEKVSWQIFHPFYSTLFNFPSCFTDWYIYIYICMAHRGRAGLWKSPTLLWGVSPREPTTRRPKQQRAEKPQHFTGVAAKLNHGARGKIMVMALKRIEWAE